MVTLPGNYANVHAYAEDLLGFVHRPLAIQITGGIHVNDAFIYDAWHQLPKEWTDWWETIEDYRDAQRNLIRSLDENFGADAEDLAGRPPSLSQWLDQLRGLALRREQIALADKMDVVEMPSLLTSHMNTKKFAEVRTAASYIRHICDLHGIKRVVDIGSGQGYLSLILAAVCGLKVLAIDGSSKQIEGSKSAARRAGLTEGQDITHCVRFVDGSGRVSQDVQTWCQGEPCMLVGLHACGSLSEHMIRLFTTTPDIKALAFAGCCYNHISPLSAAQPDGFPISHYMRSNGLTLSTSALITGCQAPTNWAHNPDSTFSRKYFYRALLEKLLYDKGLADTEDRSVWGIRTGDLKDFKSYAARALGRLGFQVGTDVTEADIDSYESNFQGREGETAILWTLSVLLCRVVESIIALDRWFYLVEQGSTSVKVLPLFDYRTSPRNLVIVAKKGELSEVLP